MDCKLPIESFLYIRSLRDSHFPVQEYPEARNVDSTPVCLPHKLSYPLQVLIRHHMPATFYVSG